ncbi:MAG: hypothetical protein ACRDTR_07155, partial [Rubrobacter sp.]
MKPSSGAIPYLHVRQTEGSLLPSGLSITGNTKALVQLRKQIDRALEDAEGYPLDDATYRELGGDEY